MAKNLFPIPFEPTLMRVPSAGCQWLAGPVSRDVVLGCNHRSTTGDVWFPGGQRATIKNQSVVGHTDIRVYVLDRQLDVEPLPIASPEFYRPLKNRGIVYAYYVNRSREHGVAKFTTMGTGNILFAPVDKANTLITHAGDSGSPVFGFEHGRYALATHWFNGLRGPAYGPLYAFICIIVKGLGATDMPRLNKP